MLRMVVHGMKRRELNGSSKPEKPPEKSRLSFPFLLKLIIVMHFHRAVPGLDTHLIALPLFSVRHVRIIADETSASLVDFAEGGQVHRCLW